MFYGNRLFEATDSVLNRDDQLLPYHRLRQHCGKRGHKLSTADLLPAQMPPGEKAEYHSFGIMSNLPRLAARRDVVLKSFMVMEPPFVAPHLYRALPLLTRLFETVYVHNVHGDGYSLVDVDQGRLDKLYWPQPYADIVPTLWENKTREARFVMISTNAIAPDWPNELKSVRLHAAGALARRNAIHLYGHGWNKPLTRKSRFRWGFYGPNIRNHLHFRRAYRGRPESKLETLSRYAFSICMENMRMSGYITEKIFDCLYAGTVPYYLGPPDATRYLPSNVFVDLSQFSDWGQAYEHACSLDASALQEYRDAARDFIRGPLGEPFRTSLARVIDAPPRPGDSQSGPSAGPVPWNLAG